MDFLKDVLGDLFPAFSEKINGYNRDNPNCPVKLCDLSSGNYVSRGKFLDLKAEEKRLREQLSAMEGAEDDARISALCAQNQRYEQELARLETELFTTKRDNAIDLAIERAGARNAKAVRALLDVDALKEEEGQLVGLSAQLDKIREENGFLFRQGAVSTAMPQGAAKPPEDSFVVSARAAAGLDI